MSVTRKFLKGHKDSIVSLESNTESGLLISSCEDGSVRLWDLREKFTSTRMLRLPCTDDVGYCHLSDDILSVSSGSSLFGFDLRATASIIVTSPSFRFEAGEDEDINDYCITDESYFLPTDSGSVKQVSRSTFTEQANTQSHSNIASVCRLLPCGDQIVSGSYDCRIATAKIHASGLERQKDFPVGSLIPVAEDDDTSASCQTVNPPFVTGLEISPTGSQLGVALGDGSVFALDLRKGGSKIDVRRPAWGGANIHSVSVSSICWSNDSSSIWSVGNDSVLIRMTEDHISVRYALEGYKPNCVVEVSPGQVAVGGTSNEIELIHFR
jgi:WD40 repeat protein